MAVRDLRGDLRPCVLIRQYALRVAAFIKQRDRIISDLVYCVYGAAGSVNDVIKVV